MEAFFLLVNALSDNSSSLSVQVSVVLNIASA